MLSALILSMAVTPSFDPTGPKKYPNIYIPADAPYGFLYQPAYDLHIIPRWPAVGYAPKAGDILLLSDTNRFWTTLYRFALTGKPGHAGVIVTMPDGGLGVLEAGYNDTLWTRITPLAYRINQYHGTVWVRQRKVALTPEEDRRLTYFAAVANGGRYAVGQFGLQITPFRNRGPLRTYFVGKPKGLDDRFFCAEETVEALAYAGLIDRRTARPSATFPQDLFYDRSRNLYIDRHPPLAEGWEPPKLWTPLLGSTLTGKARPHPPLPWPGGSAYAVYPLLTGTKEPPTSAIVEYVPGEFRPVTDFQQPPQRIGYFDRPTGLFRRR